jgi:hypothetical protein
MVFLKEMHKDKMLDTLKILDLSRLKKDKCCKMLNLGNEHDRFLCFKKEKTKTAFIFISL